MDKDKKYVYDKKYYYVSIEQQLYRLTKKHYEEFENLLAMDRGKHGEYFSKAMVYAEKNGLYIRAISCYNY